MSGGGLVPATLLKRLPALYTTQRLADPVAQVKIVTPWSDWTWYVLEYDGDDLCFAWVEGHESELGYVSLAELSSVRGLLGMRAVCDESFVPTRVSQLRHIERMVHYADAERER